MQQLLEYLKSNRDYLVDFVNNELPGIRILIPEATYLAWMDFSRPGKTDEELQEWMTQEVGIGLNPGPMFGPGGSGFMRINFACPKTQLELALQKLKKFL
jgi:cystathionine beta-lyase